MGRVDAVCISEKKGTQKQDVGRAEFVADWGIRGDTHAGKWHRQVSLLSLDRVEEFRARGALLVAGFDFKTLPVGSRFRCGQVELEMTQVGKQCHAHCAIYHQVGDCIMPREGVFARVLHGGTISVGDELILLKEGGET